MGLFELSAFDRMLEIEPLLKLLQIIFSHLGPDFEAHIQPAVEAHAKENGLDVQKLMESASGGLVISAQIRVGDEAGPFVRDINIPDMDASNVFGSNPFHTSTD